jgi:hypothetical protein
MLVEALLLLRLSQDTKCRLTGCSSSSYCGTVDWTRKRGLAAGEADGCFVFGGTSHGFLKYIVRRDAGLWTHVTMRNGE